jgi:hypothetical protein
MRRWTVLGLPFQLVFLGQSIEPILKGVSIEGHLIDTNAEINFKVVHLTVLCHQLKQNKNTNETEVASNKSSLLLKILIQNTQTLQLVSMNHKTESIYKSY